MNHVPLPRSFFSESAEVVAPRLLGHFLLRRWRGQWCGGAIVETEAYLALDPACHSYGGRTERNRSMFGAPGLAYVYLIYGLHYCFNAVCQPEGCGEAVLVRAIETTFGEQQMRRFRPHTSQADLTNGPAKLCQALKIDRQLDGVDLGNVNSPIILARNPDHEAFLLQQSPIITTTRIGITRAADVPLRFYLAGSRFVSRRATKA